MVEAIIQINKMLIVEFTEHVPPTMTEYCSLSGMFIWHREKPTPGTLAWK